MFDPLRFCMQTFKKKNQAYSTTYSMYIAVCSFKLKQNQSTYSEFSLSQHHYLGVCMWIAGIAISDARCVCC